MKDLVLRILFAVIIGIFISAGIYVGTSETYWNAGNVEIVK